MGRFSMFLGLSANSGSLTDFFGYLTIIQPFSTELQNTDNDLSDYFPNSSKVGTQLVPLQKIHSYSGCLRTLGLNSLAETWLRMTIGQKYSFQVTGLPFIKVFVHLIILPPTYSFNKQLCSVVGISQAQYFGIERLELSLSEILQMMEMRTPERLSNLPKGFGNNSRQSQGQKQVPEWASVPREDLSTAFHFKDRNM